MTKEIAKTGVDRRFCKPSKVMYEAGSGLSMVQLDKAPRDLRNQQDRRWTKIPKVQKIKIQISTKMSNFDKNCFCQNLNFFRLIRVNTNQFGPGAICFGPEHPRCSYPHLRYDARTAMYPLFFARRQTRKLQ